jgi:hypothetical protein
MSLLEWIAAGMLGIAAVHLVAVILVIRHVRRHHREPAPRDPAIEAVYQEAMTTLREYRPS